MYNLQNLTLEIGLSIWLKMSFTNIKELAKSWKNSSKVSATTLSIVVSEVWPIVNELYIEYKACFPSTNNILVSFSLNKSMISKKNNNTYLLLKATNIKVFFSSFCRKATTNITPPRSPCCDTFFILNKAKLKTVKYICITKLIHLVQEMLMHLLYNLTRKQPNIWISALQNIA